MALRTELLQLKTAHEALLERFRAALDANATLQRETSRQV